MDQSNVLIESTLDRFKLRRQHSVPEPLLRIINTVETVRTCRLDVIALCDEMYINFDEENTDFSKLNAKLGEFAAGITAVRKNLNVLPLLTGRQWEDFLPEWAFKSQRFLHECEHVLKEQLPELYRARTQLQIEQSIPLLLYIRDTVNAFDLEGILAVLQMVCDEESWEEATIIQDLRHLRSLRLELENARSQISNLKLEVSNLQKAIEDIKFTVVEEVRKEARSTIATAMQDVDESVKEFKKQIDLAAKEATESIEKQHKKLLDDILRTQLQLSKDYEQLSSQTSEAVRRLERVSHSLHDLMQIIGSKLKDPDFVSQIENSHLNLITKELSDASEKVVVNPEVDITEEDQQENIHAFRIYRELDERAKRFLLLLDEHKAYDVDSAVLATTVDTDPRFGKWYRNIAEDLTGGFGAVGPVRKCKVRENGRELIAYALNQLGIDILSIIKEMDPDLVI